MTNPTTKKEFYGQEGNVGNAQALPWMTLIAGPWVFVNKFGLKEMRAAMFNNITGPETLYTQDRNEKLNEPNVNFEMTEPPLNSPLYNLLDLYRRPNDTVFLCEHPYLADQVSATGRLAVATCGDALRFDLTSLERRSVILIGISDPNPTNDWMYDTQDALGEVVVNELRAVKRFFDKPKHHTIFDEENAEQLLLDSETSKSIKERDPDMIELDSNSHADRTNEFEGLMRSPYYSEASPKYLIPAKGLGIVAGDGAIGKSFLAQLLCSSVGYKNVGQDFKVACCGIEKAGIGVYLTAEETFSIVSETQKRVADYKNIPDDVRFEANKFIYRKPYGSLRQSPEIIEFDQKTNKVRALPQFSKLRRELNQLKERTGQPIRVVVFDNASQMLSLDSNNQFQVVKCQRLLSSLADELDCLVILLTHTRKSSANSASGSMDTKKIADMILGSTGWKTGVRFVLTGFKEEGTPKNILAKLKNLGRKDAVIGDDLVYFALAKHNLGPNMYSGEPLRFHKSMNKGDFEFISDADVEKSGAEMTDNVRTAIINLIKIGQNSGNLMTINKIENGDHPENELLDSVGQKRKRSLCKEMIDEGTIFKGDGSAKNKDFLFYTAPGEIV